MKTVIIITGNKGSGKTYTGSLIEKEMSIPFLRVEPIFLNIIKGRNPFDPEYIHEGFILVEKELLKILENSNIVSFETTGVAEESKELINKLKLKNRVIIIRIDASPELCLQRIRKRDQTEHISVSEDLIHEINAAVPLQNIKADLILKNETLTGKEIIASISNFINKIKNHDKY